MDAKAIVESYNFIEPVLAALTLVVLFRARQVRTILPLSLLMAAVIFDNLAYHSLHLWAIREREHHSYLLAYNIYFYTHWICYALEAGITFLLIRRLYELALEPMAGLRYLGMVVFRWIAVASVLIAVFTSITPHVTALQFFVSAATGLERTQSVMVLCLLFFLTFAAQPLCFTYKNRIFGVGIGLGLMACTDLVGSAWFSQDPSFYSMYNVVKGMVAVTAMIIWTVYYILPEAKRGLVTLPVSSPLLRWNDIGIALGYPETHVVVASEGVPLFGASGVESTQIEQGHSSFSTAANVA